MSPFMIVSRLGEYRQRMADFGSSIHHDLSLCLSRSSSHGQPNHIRDTIPHFYQMGCSSSHVAEDKDDLVLMYAEEGRLPNTHETAKQRNRRERAEKTIRRRRERVLAKHRRKAIECMGANNLGVCPAHCQTGL